MRAKYRRQREREMQEKRFHVVLYHNNHQVGKITSPSFFRKMPKLLAYYGVLILMYYIFQFGMSNYSVYKSLNVACEQERQQVDEVKMIHEKVVAIRDDIQRKYLK